MKTVAVWGASTDRNKFGNKAVRAFRDCGYQVYPINAKESVVEGIGSYPSLQAVPAKPDIVSVYLPPPVLLGLLRDLAAAGVGEFWLNPGTDTPEVISALRRLNIPFLQACSLIQLGVDPSDY